MKPPVFSLALAALLSSLANAAPAPAGIQASTVPSNTPYFTMGALTMRPIGIKQVGDDWYYVQCADYPHGDQVCLPIVPTYVMRGLEVRSAIALDGSTPLTWFLQTEAATPDAGDRQSAAIVTFNERHAEVLEQFADPNASAASLRASTVPSRACAREPGSRAAKACAATGSDPDPDPLPTANLQQVEVPGPRPDPEYPSFDPAPLDPSAPPTGDDPGNAGDPGSPEQPDGSSWRRIKPLTEICIGAPPPVIGGGCVVRLPKPKPPLVDPEAEPLPPPKPSWTWCSLVGIGCTSGEPAPGPDGREGVCATKFGVDSAVCINDRINGRSTPEKEKQCLAAKYAELGRCRATLGNPLTAGN
jgi:hypothetical protein